MSAIMLHCHPLLAAHYSHPSPLLFAHIDNAVHIWQCQWRAVPLAKVAELYNTLLSDQEKQRADAFRFVQDKHRYVVMYATLRYLLGQYVNQAPQQLTFVRNPRHKPHLAQHPTWQFSLSYSTDSIAIAIAQHQAIGIDIESKDAHKLDWQSISQHYFSPTEQALLQQQTQANLFLLWWTRKEALLKATGAGLSEDMQYLQVNDGIHRIDKPLTSPYHQGEQTWHIQSFDLTAHYISVALPKLTEMLLLPYQW
jgi:4'-phosphopantetheinyl transferase